MIKKINAETSNIIEQVAMSIDFSTTKRDLLENVSELIIDLSMRAEDLIVKMENEMFISPKIGLAFEDIKIKNDINIENVKRLMFSDNQGSRFLSIKKKLVEAFEIAKENLETFTNLITL